MDGAHESDNSTRGVVTGWMRFLGLTGNVTFDLKCDFHRDIRGTKIRLRGKGSSDDSSAAESMKGVADHQTGVVGDITAGLWPFKH